MFKFKNTFEMWQSVNTAEEDCKTWQGMYLFVFHGIILWLIKDVSIFYFWRRIHSSLTGYLYNNSLCLSVCLLYFFFVVIWRNDLNKMVSFSSIIMHNLWIVDIFSKNLQPFPLKFDINLSHHRMHQCMWNVIWCISHT